VLHHGVSGSEAVGSAGIPQEWIARYEERFATANPYLVEARKRKPEGGAPFIASADHLVPFAQVKQTEFYKAFLTPLGVNDSVGALLFEGPGPLGHVFIRRKSGALRYGEAEEARLRSIVDILASALTRSKLLRISNARLAALDQLTARTQGGLIILDERSNVLEAEGAGRVIVDSQREALAEAAARFAGDAASSRGHFTTAAENGLEYEFRKVVIEGRVRILCVLGSSGVSQSDGLQVPSHIHFTPRERDVLVLLARGLDNISIARSLGIGLYTTKDHVKSIFRKLGVRTRAEAVAVLSRSGSGLA
jgi:DNA-binding CsgD family transcriptional regulator